MEYDESKWIKEAKSVSPKRFLCLTFLLSFFLIYFFFYFPFGLDPGNFYCITELCYASVRILFYQTFHLFRFFPCSFVRSVLSFSQLFHLLIRSFTCCLCVDISLCYMNVCIWCLYCGYFYVFFFSFLLFSIQSWSNFLMKEMINNGKFNSFHCLAIGFYLG